MTISPQIKDIIDFAKQANDKIEEELNKPAPNFNDILTALQNGAQLGYKPNNYTKTLYERLEQKIPLNREQKKQILKAVNQNYYTDERLAVTTNIDKEFKKFGVPKKTTIFTIDNFITLVVVIGCISLLISLMYHESYVTPIYNTTESAQLLISDQLAKAAEIPLGV